MTVATYNPALALVLGHEGGYVNHPLDPGGATNKGVTQRVYDAYRRVHGLPTRSVRYIESGEVKIIYKENYWNLVRGDILPAGLDYAMFDFAINSGVSRAIKYLQAGLGFTGEDIDGVIGDLTRTRVNEAAKANEVLLIQKLCEDRMRFVRGLKTFKTFGKGWTRRIMGNLDGAQPDKDTGVIDYAIAFAMRDPIFTVPTTIGKLDGEVAGKAIPTPSLGVSYQEALSTGWGV